MDQMQILWLGVWGEYATLHQRSMGRVYKFMHRLIYTRYFINRSMGFCVFGKYQRQFISSKFKTKKTCSFVVSIKSNFKVM